METKLWIFRCEEGHYHTVRDEVRWNIMSLIGFLPMIDQGVEIPFPDPGGDIVPEINSNHLFVNVLNKKCPQKYPPSLLPVPPTMQKIMDILRAEFKKEIGDMMEIAKAEWKKETSDLLERMKSDLRDEIMKDARMTTPPQKDESTDQGAQMTTPSQKDESTDQGAQMTTPPQKGESTDQGAQMTTPPQKDESTDQGARMTTPPQKDNISIENYIAQIRQAAEAAAEANLTKFPDLREKLENQKKTQVVNLQITRTSTHEAKPREVKKVNETVTNGKRSMWDDSGPGDSPNSDEAVAVKKQKQTTAVGLDFWDPVSDEDELESSFADMVPFVQNSILLERVTPMCAEFLGRARSFMHRTTIRDYTRRCAPIVTINLAVWIQNPKKNPPQTEAIETLLDPLTNISFLTESLKGSHELRKRVRCTIKKSKKHVNYIRWLDQTQFNLQGNANLDWYAETIRNNGARSKTSRQFTNFEVLNRCAVKIPVLGLNFLKEYIVGLNPEATEVVLVKKDYQYNILKLPISRWVILTEKFVRNETGIFGANRTPELISKLYDEDEIHGRDIMKRWEERGEEVRDAILKQCPRHFEYCDVMPEHEKCSRELLNGDVQHDVQDDRVRHRSFQEEEKTYNTH